MKFDTAKDEVDSNQASQVNSNRASSNNSGRSNPNNPAKTISDGEYDSDDDMLRVNDEKPRSGETSDIKES